jgi:uncharacterized protein YjeT (DUF2065 family)
MKSLILSSLSLACLSVMLEAQLPPGPLLEIKSPNFAPGGPIPKKFTCEGIGHSPGLLINGVPKETKSLVLTVLKVPLSTVALVEDIGMALMAAGMLVAL